MSIFELTHTAGYPVDIGSFWHSGYEVFEFNQLAHALEMRPSRELALKARLTSNTIIAVIGVLGLYEEEQTQI